MSFLSTSQRAYDPLSQSELSHLPRAPVSSLDSFQDINSSAMQSLVPQSSQHAHSHQSHLPDRPQISLPKIGETRCYWALLSGDLRFLYTDPVLAYHLQEQADLLIGKSLLQFVHPDEQTSAEQDLGGVLESRTLHGSVTRVRFSRLSRVRRQLGHRGNTPPWVDAEKIAVDDNYMAVDIVINWAADGVVLCFIHAVVDLTPHDNDEFRKTGWTNWCGTPYMSQDEVNMLFQRLCNAIPPTTSMDRVFQILLNQPDRPLWCSWPPDRQQVQGGPVAKDFAKIAADVNIGNNPNSSSDAKTSCTRRYKAQQAMPYGAEGLRDVESIFIPYGSIIFACHKVDSPTDKNGNSYLQNSAPHYYDTPAYNLPPLNVPSEPYSGAYGPPSANAQYSHWSASSDSAQSPYSPWTPQHAPISSSPSVSSIRSSSYAGQPPPTPHQPPQATQQQQHQWSSQPPASAYMEPNSGSSYYPGSVPYEGTPAVGTPTMEHPSSAADDVVPAPRSGNRRSVNKDQYGSAGRTTGNPPHGIMKCSSCKVTHSPEWRKGPSGKKDLCNACGLRYARSRAKKEGGPVRRRKDKVLAAMSNKSEHSPSTSPVNAPFNDSRRGSEYDENAGTPGPAGSPPGNEPYPPTPQHAHPHAQLPDHNGMKPSPSPPLGSGGSFTGYTQPSSQHDHHHHQNHGNHQRGPPHYSQSYYTLPSGPGLPPGHPPNSHTLPRLDALSGMPYSGRLTPPSQSPPSPMPGSHFALPSYERDRRHDKERERMALPPTPVSADPRSGPGRY